MANLTREQILARKTGRGVAKLPDGSTVAIRALTRDEVLESQELASTGDRDNFIIATGMTDPVMTPDEVGQWGASGDAGDLVAVSDAIGELSKLKEGSGKAAYKSARGKPRSGV